MRRKLRDLQPARRHRAANLLAVALALRRSLQIKQPRIPRRNLHALIAELARPRRDTLQIVKWRRIPCKLRQEYRRPFDRPHRPLNTTLPLLCILASVLFLRGTATLGCALIKPPANTNPLAAHFSLVAQPLLVVRRTRCL